MSIRPMKLQKQTAYETDQFASKQTSRKNQTREVSERSALESHLNKLPEESSQRRIKTFSEGMLRIEKWDARWKEKGSDPGLLCSNAEKSKDDWARSRTGTNLRRRRPVSLSPSIYISLVSGKGKAENWGVYIGDSWAMADGGDPWKVWFRYGP